MRLATATLVPAPGERLVADFLRGDEPAYVYLHGYASVRAGEKSDALLAHAAARGRAAARFDFRGHGQSSGRIGHVTLGEMIVDAEAVLARFDQAVLFGSSIGGLVAAFTAARWPDRVAGLVLLAPAFGYLRRLTARMDAHGRLRTSSGLEVPMDPRALADAALHDEDALPAALPMPVLVVHGSADEVVPPVLSERFFAAIPHRHKELWLVPEGDHRLNRPIREVLARMDRLIG